MILKEKIQTIIIDDYGNFQKILLLEKIAEDFAIEFQDWCMNLINKYGFLEYKRNFANKTSKELFEIFKKEKGL